MRILSHNVAPKINVNFVEFQGVVDANYHDLVNVFGEPMEGDLYKIDVQWKLRIVTDDKKTHSVLLHNYKNGKNYLGEDGLEKENIPTWHVSVSKKTDINASAYIKKYLKEKLSK